MQKVECCVSNTQFISAISYYAYIIEISSNIKTSNLNLWYRKCKIFNDILDVGTFSQLQEDLSHLVLTGHAGPWRRRNKWFCWQNRLAMRTFGTNQSAEVGPAFRGIGAPFAGAREEFCLKQVISPRLCAPQNVSEHRSDRRSRGNCLCCCHDQVLALWGRFMFHYNVKT